MKTLCYGAILVVALTTAAAAQAPLFTLHGSDPGGRFGFAVRSIGDADGDGHTDFGVGAPMTDANGILDSGMLRAYSGATGLKLREFRGNGLHEGSGSALACAGDVDGDGKADLMWSDLDGRWRYPGQFTVASGASGRVLLRVHGQAADDYLGRSLCEAGDVDGDGYSDFAAGEPGCDDNGNCSGRVRVFSGKTKLPIHTFLGTAANQEFGTALACAGDLDGDGVVDLIVGAPRANQPGRVECGLVLVFSGKSGAVLFTWYGDRAGDRLGTGVAGDADVDGDGVPDVIAGASLHANAAGMVRAFSGRTGAVIRTWLGQNPGDRLGSAVGVGDVDGDGFADVIAGAPSWNAETGRVLVLSGNGSAILATLDGSSVGGRFGFSVDDAGDVDGDGYVDVIVGAPDDVVSGVPVGSASVYSFGGTGTPPWVAYRGAGCRGAEHRLPRIDVFGRPVLGGAYAAQLRGARANAPATLNLGTAWDEGFGPFAPGCTAYALPLLPLAVTTNAEGAARLAPVATIPNEPTLLGAELHHQWIVIDWAANALGVSASNDAVVRIGR